MFSRLVELLHSQLPVDLLVCLLLSRMDGLLLSGLISFLSWLVYVA